TALTALAQAFSLNLAASTLDVDTGTLATFCQIASVTLSPLADSSTCRTWSTYYDGLVRSGVYGRSAAEYQRYCQTSVAILTSPSGATLDSVYGQYGCVPSSPCCTPWGVTPGPAVCSSTLARGVQCRPGAQGNGGKCVVV
ncbi:hypothetical protein HaLaN_23340, partial [Haematococcus lacustris]